MYFSSKCAGVYRDKKIQCQEFVLRYFRREEIGEASMLTSTKLLILNAEYIELIILFCVYLNIFTRRNV